MKFGRYLQSHAIPEWRSEHVNYKRFKQLIKRMVIKFPRTHSAVFAGDVLFHFDDEMDSMRTRAIAASPEEQQFVELLHSEMAKCDAFVDGRMEMIKQQQRELANQLQQLQQSQRHLSKGRWPKHIGSAEEMAHEIIGDSWTSALCCHRQSELIVSTRKLKTAFLEFYRTLALLETYQTLNVTAFSKALKKHDKNTGLNLSSTWNSVVQGRRFNTADLREYQAWTERQYTSQLMGGNRDRAMDELRVPPKTFLFVNWSFIFVGFAFGFALLSATIAIVAASKNDSDSFPQFTQMFRGFRGLLLTALMPIFIGFDMYGWHTHHVNYPLIFGLDARNHADYLFLVSNGCKLLLVWCMCMLLYVFHPSLGFSGELTSLIYLCFAVAFVINPLNIICKRESRYWLLRVLFRIIRAPFVDVRFEDFWLADQLTSMTAVLLDIEYIVCFLAYDRDKPDSADDRVCGSVKYGLRPILTVLPFWWRFAQCLRRYRDTKKAFPHLVNAGKYSTAFFVVLFSSLATGTKEDEGEAEINGFFICWILAATVNMLYSFMWDILMDWGLFKKGAKYRFLRNKLEYSPSWYYIAIGVDFICRALWTLSLSIGFFNTTLLADWLVFVFALSEIFRRCVWNLFRLENEHANNCGEFRVTRELPLPFDGLVLVPPHDDDDDEDEEEERDLRAQLMHDDPAYIEGRRASEFHVQG